MSRSQAAALPISGGRVWEIIVRSLRYLGPFRREVMIKILFGIITLFPALVMPWPLKVILDHVIRGVPITPDMKGYPFFFMPVLEALQGAPVETVCFAMVGILTFTMFVVGRIGTAGDESDSVEATMASGLDTATRTENEANMGFSLAGGLFGWVDFQWTIRLTQKFNHYYRAALFKKIQSLPLTTFDDARIGDVVYRVMYDTPAITNLCYRVILRPVLGLINIGLMIWIMVLVYGGHSAVITGALLMLPGMLLATWPLAALMRRRASAARIAGGQTTTTIEEGMANMMAVQGLGAEASEKQRFDNDSADSFKGYRFLRMVELGGWLSGALAVFLLLFWVIWNVVGSIVHGELEVGDFAVLMSYFGSIAIAAGGLGSLWIYLQNSLSGLDRVFYLMDLPDEETTAGSNTLPPVRDRVEFDKVSFRYGDGAPVLEDISLTAGRGGLTALVGPAGAGKTTLAYMIPAFHRPASGRILIDGHDLREISLDSLRDQVAFVFQENTLFDDTIRGNIMLGNPKATDLELREAARLAGASEFIEALPEGYDTPLGRSGGRLSVGQKQRLSIARALISKKPVIIFDEPTSALDVVTGNHIAEVMEEISRDHIVLVIAHRLSTVRHAAQILYLENGHIRERGTHDELMAHEDGAYRRFVDLQSAELH